MDTSTDMIAVSLLHRKIQDPKEWAAEFLKVVPLNYGAVDNPIEVMESWFFYALETGMRIEEARLRVIIQDQLREVFKEYEEMLS